MGRQRKGEGIDQTQGRSFGPIADCRFHTLGIQRLNPQAKTKEGLPAVRAEVYQLLLEQQVWHRELKIELERLVQ